MISNIGTTVPDSAPDLRLSHDLAVDFDDHDVAAGINAVVALDLDPHVFGVSTHGILSASLQTFMSSVSSA